MTGVEFLPALVPVPMVERLFDRVVSRNTVHSWLRSGRIRIVQPGGRRGRRSVPRAETERPLSGGAAGQRSHLAAHHERSET